MTIFEYPHVTISILAAVFLAMCMFGLYFTVKSVKASKETAKKNFCSIGKIKNDFEKAGALRKKRSVIYVSISLDSMKRLYSESKAVRMYGQIKRILFNHLCLAADGEISLCGNENFAALNYLESNETEQLLEKCFRRINEIFIEHGAVNIARLHFGYICTGSTEISFETALERAKHALSMAEDKGVLYCRWDNMNGKEFERKLKIENNIQSEIDNDRFFLEYQPILDAKTNKIVGAEVFARLNSPTEGVLTPSSFISAVNNVGLNKKFDYYIFEKNCKWISNDKENRIKYVYATNFSRSTLSDKNLVENLVSIIKKYDIDYSCIAVEILEDKRMNEDEKASMIKNLKRLKEKGILILLDDFGKGYTSFGDLTDFSLSIVKIDKDITKSAVSKTGFLILKNIIKTAHDLGLKALCEGIETEEFKKAASEAGCDMFQGYCFYPPMPAAQFESLSKKSNRLL